MTLQKWLERTAKWYVQEHGLQEVSDINNGHCVAFAEMVESAEEEFESVSIDAFLKDGWTGSGQDEWDEREFAAYGIEPRDVGRLVYHVFLHDGKRFYDAETPEGVDHFLDLPIYRQQVTESL